MLIVTLANVKAMLCSHSDALHLQVSSENGYHSEINHFTTGCLLILWRNNCQNIFLVQHYLVIKIHQSCTPQHR